MQHYASCYLNAATSAPSAIQNNAATSAPSAIRLPHDASCSIDDATYAPSAIRPDAATSAPSAIRPIMGSVSCWYQPADTKSLVAGFYRQ